MIANQNFEFRSWVLIFVHEFCHLFISFDICSSVLTFLYQLMYYVHFIFCFDICSSVLLSIYASESSEFESDSFSNSCNCLTTISQKPSWGSKNLYEVAIFKQVGFPCWVAVGPLGNRPDEVDSTVIHRGINHPTGDPTPHWETCPTGDFSQWGPSGYRWSILGGSILGGSILGGSIGGPWGPGPIGPKVPSVPRSHRSPQGIHGSPPGIPGNPYKIFSKFIL